MIKVLEGPGLFYFCEDGEEWEGEVDVHMTVCS